VFVYVCNFTIYVYIINYIKSACVYKDYVKKVIYILNKSGSNLYFK